jgi:hypothetical protein
MRNTVVRKDVGRDVHSDADTDSHENRSAEVDEQGRRREGPYPERIVADQAVRARMLVMRLVPAPQRAVKQEAMHDRHEGLEGDQRKNRDKKLRGHPIRA